MSASEAATVIAPRRAEPDAPAVMPHSRPERAPLVLLHAGPPWQENGGSVFLDAIAEHVARPCVHVAVSLEGRTVEVPPAFTRPVLQVAARGGIRGFGVLRRMSPWLERQAYWGVASPRLLAVRTRDVAKQLAALHPHRLAVFLNSVEVPIVASELVRLLKVPYVTMEWDLLDVAIDRLRLAAPIRRRALDDLHELRCGAAERGVASEGMEEMYRDRWGLDSVVLRQPARVDRRREAKEGNRPFVIAFCGNVYAAEEFRTFLGALDSLNWTVGNRPIELLVIGALGADFGPVPSRVGVTGWVPFAESLRLLRGADLGYCPYWFDSSHADIVATSFPSKLISYLTCEVPVFYHGPANGSPARFLARYPAGVTCTSQDVGGVASELVRLVAAPERLLLARRAGETALAREFSPEILRERLKVWLNDREPAR